MDVLRCLAPVVSDVAIGAALGGFPCFVRSDRLTQQLTDAFKQSAGGKLAAYEETLAKLDEVKTQSKEAARELLKKTNKPLVIAIDEL